MKIFNDLDAIKKIENNFILTIGNYDGFHIGHLTILNKMDRISENTGFIKVAITFRNKPLHFIKKKECNINIIPLKDKVSFFEKKGFKYLILLDFNDKIRNMDKDSFLNKLLESTYFKGLIVGENFRFGKNREGSTEYLSKILISKNLIFHSIPIQKKDGISISSSYIRKRIKKGDLSINKYLNEPFYIKGIVERGKTLGRKINYPTANIYVFDQIKPLDGVYFTITEIKEELLKEELVEIKNKKHLLEIDEISVQKKQYFSMTFVGHDGHVETHIFDFDKDIYGNEIKVYFLYYIRKNRYVKNIKELKLLLDSDKEFIYQNLIKNHNTNEGIDYEQFRTINSNIK